MHLSQIPLQKLLLILFVGAFMNVVENVNAQDPKAPKATEVPHEMTMHGHTRNDEFYWLRERENPDVISYLNLENEYTKSKMADVEPLQKKLFDETVARIKQNDQSVPYTWNGFVYYTRYEEGKQYPIYCRKPLAPDSDEQIMVNVNELAEGKSYCNVVGMEVSPDNKLLAYGVDFQGRRKYNIHVKNLETGELLPDMIENVTGGCEWANDNATIFYLKKDPQTLRSYLVRRHKLGTSVDSDVDVFEETDEQFNCYMYKSRSRDYIFVVSSQTLSTEIRMLDADDPEGEFQVFHTRQPNHEYSIDHLGGDFYIRSNEQAVNFRLFKVSEQKLQRDAWQEVIPHRQHVYLLDFDLFDDYLIVEERKDALTQLRIRSLDGTRDEYMPFDESAYVVRSSPTPEPATDWLRYNYTSLTTPGSTFEINLKTGEKKLLKQDEVLGDFKSANYKLSLIHI